MRLIHQQSEASRYPNSLCSETGHRPRSPGAIPCLRWPLSFGIHRWKWAAVFGKSMLAILRKLDDFHGNWMGS
jgi:hypothetical protein